MSANVNFIKALIRKAEIKDSDVGAFVRIHFTSEWTEDVMAAMAWTDPGDSTKKDEMIGELESGNFVLTPDSEMLAKNEIEFTFYSAGGFFIHNIVKDEQRRREFRFYVDSNAPESAQKVYDYKRTMKKQTGKLQLKYGVQETLPI